MIPNDSFIRVVDEELVIYEMLLRDFISFGDLNGTMDNDGFRFDFTKGFTQKTSTDDSSKIYTSFK